jgi:hypothetical protein
MPTLADIYSAINTAKRKGSDFVQNPVTSLQQMVGNANDRARGYNQEMVQAAQGFGAPARGQQATPEQLAAQQSTMDIFAEAYNPVGMTVFHGSPHIFQKFDISKIGTGEGNQAYGRGLYMAESPGVAGSYAANLTTKPVRINGKSIEEVLTDPNAVRFMRDANGDLELAKNLAKQEWTKYKNAEPSATMREYVEEAQQQLNSIDPAKVNIERPGYLYKVDLPDTHIRRMLDFDTPLKNQPKPVRNLAKSLGMDMNDLGGDLIGIIGKGDKGKQILQDAGIPGIKYLDQASRDTKTGTRNFVVFDDKHLKILERNDQPIK